MSGINGDEEEQPASRSAAWNTRQRTCVIFKACGCAYIAG